MNRPYFSIFDNSSMINACPVCRSEEILNLIEISDFPILSNVLWTSRESALNSPRGDIRLRFCQVCGHTFNQAFEPEKMVYTQGYENSLHFSARFQEYAVDLANRLIQHYSLRNKDIIEIGSGQGDFLTLLCRLGDNRGVGFDPSYVVPENGSSHHKVAFEKDLYSEIYKDYPVDFLVCRHVFEHIDNPVDFLAMVKRSIEDHRHAILFFEVPNVEYTICNEGIWDILYEHVSYFSAHSLAYVFSHTDFEVLEISKTFGEQFLTIEATLNRGGSSASSRTDALINLEQAADSFVDLYQNKVNLWKERLEMFRKLNLRTVVWGAGTKGISFLNTLDSLNIIDYVVDINPRKKGMHVTGSGQEIVSPEYLKTYKPDKIILMNGNYEKEVKGILRDLGVKVEILVA